ncbi:MAG TPA: carotenoid oxygenase family protein, partial [Acidimicrobiales bacterium]|nr:carotenoid oxygenase family protein [Acidimicrobiales bacterium]
MHATSDLDPLHAIPPVPDETTIYHLTVRGQLPPTLAGVHLTLGPNPIGGWSTGRTDPMVHRVDIRDGRALAYRNRWILTDPTADVLGVERVPGPRPAPQALTRLDVIADTILTTGLGETGFELAPDLTTIRTVDATDRMIARTSAREARQSRTHIARAADTLDPAAEWLIATTHLE